MRLTTSRLLLRPWTPQDLPALTALNADPEVNVWLGGASLASHSAEALQTMRDRLAANGWGVLAVCDAQDELLGVAGLQPVRAGLPIAPAVEAVWRLRRSAWGRGYVQEAIGAILAAAAAFDSLDEIVALIARPNLRSCRTAESLGFHYDPTADFLHPALEAEHPLRPHRVYRHSLRLRADAPIRPPS